jgi:membrane associated rhomboid family serine protease
MIPLRDELPSRGRPVMTMLLILGNIVVFLYQLGLGPQRAQMFVGDFGAVPGYITGTLRYYGAPPVPWPLTILSSMFIHGGLLHLGGNMLFLWIFGDNVEDVMGSQRFLAFYLVCGAAAALTHAMLNPTSQVPMIGASGAISGVLGAYVVLFPRARVLTLIPLGFLLQTVRVPAVLFLGFWFIMQFLYGGLTRGAEGGGVAWFAHVGGFIAGLLLVFLFRRRDRLAWYRRF